ncbi:PREDICTED: mitochondrial GTPase 1-like [Rhagoletis zephyria]|uniref:mitochondrial GTPase 1-like n=1 Tax=Rhagoletis zephyria TaxID=28612 RepID=UPI0008113E2A|nr:PREDICTED: mitochondrial GTPase 1-like [Rhagoletis zephyria]
MSFREAYKLASKQSIRWFPGHMGKGLKQMQQKLRSVDCIVEVHDARVPFSGRNPEFKHTISGGAKPHILVLNKKDLTEIREQRKIAKELHEREGIEHVVFTNCKDQQCAGVKRVIPLAHKLVSSSDRYNRTGLQDASIMIIGVPNVGKSSLINVLRNKNLRKKSATQVGNTAGVTRSVMERIKISVDPLIYMIDTPGILEPCVADDEMGMKLALVGCLPDHLVGEELIADYMLYWMNKHHRFEYVKAVGLEHPTDNIAEVLVSFAKSIGVERKLKKLDGQVVNLPDVLVAARKLIKNFRNGDFGGVNLDR